MSNLKYLGRPYDFAENYNHYSDSYRMLMRSNYIPVKDTICLQFVEWCSELERFVEFPITEFTKQLSQEDAKEFIKCAADTAQPLHNLAADFDCYITKDNTIIRSAEQTEAFIELEMYHPETN